MPQWLVILSNPATLHLIALAATWLLAKFGAKQAAAWRWSNILEVAAGVVADLYSKGLKNWQDVAVEAMTQIVKEVEANPAIKSLTPKEVEQLKPYVVALAQRKNGVLPSQVAK